MVDETLKGTGIKVLIVDDNEAIIDALSYGLRAAGYDVITATNGREALERSRKEHPDLIISDIVMPEMDGFEFCRALRQDPEFSDLPFLFLTAHGDKDRKLQGLKYGADDYIVKPFEIDELLARIEVILKRAKKSATEGALSGRLSEIGLPDLLQVMEQTSKRGKVYIKAQGKEGWVSLSSGHIMDASFAELSGEDALVELFLLEDGTFYYKAEPVEKGPIDRPVGFVLMDIARLSDELVALKEFLPNEAAMVSLIQKPEEFDEPAEETIVEGLEKEGPRSVKELITFTGLSATRLKVAIAKLSKRGCIAILDSEEPVKLPSQAKVLFLSETEGIIGQFKEKLSELYGIKALKGKVMVDMVPVKTEFGTIEFVFFEKASNFKNLWRPFLKDAHLVLVAGRADESILDELEG
ncbi:MAG: response regulator, partial [Nitrospirae bacterium]